MSGYGISAGGDKAQQNHALVLVGTIHRSLLMSLAGSCFPRGTSFPHNYQPTANDSVFLLSHRSYVPFRLPQFPSRDHTGQIEADACRHRSSPPCIILLVQYWLSRQPHVKPSRRPKLVGVSRLFPSDGSLARIDVGAPIAKASMGCLPSAVYGTGPIRVGT
jgi:hypothetical protein